jgi:hypothetical protein
MIIGAALKQNYCLSCFLYLKLLQNKFGKKNENEIRSDVDSE